MHTADAPPSPGAARLRAIVAALTSIGLLGACGGGAESTEEARETAVASVAVPNKAPSASSSPSAQTERPLIRPDTSEEESDRVNQVWMDCLARKGLTMLKNSDGTWKGPLRQDAAYAEAQKTCGSKEPELLEMRAAREDPEFREKADRWVSCLRSHNVKATVQDDGLLAFDDSSVNDNAFTWAKKCEAEAFLAK
ncbi:hypothetical protein C8250_041335 [Streptomyces sp. So13.3]|uniref:hypothetical protein n=1 Tax=Streptomyces TaxID=1883 RepID=UPI001105E0C7|nr:MULTISPECIES: hypothetical protein [Streptomyces]MCZ4098490.1 hypothetical protein [Streptomyces sp. H39-C1]QNA77400.1 hypothetical protein C8250_041335 [Streptomyces sp. So13.3]